MRESKYTGPQCAGPQCTGPQCTGPQCTRPQCAGSQFARPQCAGSKRAQLWFARTRFQRFEFSEHHCAGADRKKRQVAKRGQGFAEFFSATSLLAPSVIPGSVAVIQFSQHPFGARIGGTRTIAESRTEFIGWRRRILIKSEIGKRRRSGWSRQRQEMSRVDRRFVSGVVVAEPRNWNRHRRAIPWRYDG